MGDGPSFLNHNRVGMSSSRACGLCSIPHVVRRRPDKLWQAYEVAGVLAGESRTGSTPDEACAALEQAKRGT